MGVSLGDVNSEGITDPRCVVPTLEFHLHSTRNNIKMTKLTISRKVHVYTFAVITATEISVCMAKPGSSS